MEKSFPSVPGTIFGTAPLLSVFMARTDHSTPSEVSELLHPEMKSCPAGGDSHCPAEWVRTAEEDVGPAVGVLGGDAGEIQLGELFARPAPFCWSGGRRFRLGTHTDR